MGEGYLRFVKKFLKHGITNKNWHAQTLLRMLNAKAYDSILEDLEGEDEEDVPVNHEDALSKRRLNFQKYKSVYRVCGWINATKREKKEPISVILIQTVEDKYQVLACVADFWSVMYIVLSEDDEPTHRMGLHYYKWNALAKMVDGQQLPFPWDKEAASKVKKIAFGVMLPLLEKDELEENRRFALMGENWEYLSPTVTLGDMMS